MTAGIPEGSIRLLIGGPDEGEALARSPAIDGLLFTGSVRGGQALHEQFADTPQKILALELGGNNPLVVWNAKDIEAAATISVQSAYLSAGQRCTAARRLIVEDGREGPLIDAIAGMIDRIIVDEPFADPQPFMGPVIDNATADHLQEQWVELMMKGGKPIRRLDRPFDDRPYLTPALIDVTECRTVPTRRFSGRCSDLPRLSVRVERHKCKLSLRDHSLLVAVALAGDRFGAQPQRGAPQLEQFDIDGKLVADRHRAWKFDRVRRHKDRLAAAALRGERPAGEPHLPHQPAAEYAAVRVRVRRHRRDADEGNPRLAGHYASIPSGFSTSRLKTFISRAPSAPSMARWSKLPVALITVAICRLSLIT
jgi:hypothetical protein